MKIKLELDPVVVGILQSVVQGLQRIQVQLAFLSHEEIIVAQELDDLKAEVQRNTTVETSALTLIQGIKAKIDAAVATATANGATPAMLADIKAVGDQLKANDDALAAAVAANT